MKLINFSPHILKHYIKILNYLVFKKEYPYYWGNNKEWAKTSGNKIVFICDGFKAHGGLSDRLKSILTTFSETKKINKPFYISWTSPFQLSDFLIPSGNIDWRIDKDQIYCNYKNSFPFILNISSNHFKNIIKKYLFRHCLKDKRDILVYSNIMFEKFNLPELFFSLFKPSDFLQKNLDFYLNDIGSPFYSYTFRFGNLLGDFKDIVGNPLSSKDKIKLINRNLEELKEKLKELPLGFKALVTSDSLSFLKSAKIIDNRIYVIEKELMHIDFFDEKKSNNMIWLKTFLDFFLIMTAEKVYQLNTEGMYNSSFPSFAAKIGKKPYLFHKF